MTSQFFCSFFSCELRARSSSPDRLSYLIFVWVLGTRREILFEERPKVKNILFGARRAKKMHFERDLLPEIWIFSDAYLGITGTHLPSPESYAMLTKEQQVRRYPQNRQNHAYVICERSLNQWELVRSNFNRGENPYLRLVNSDNS